MKIGLIQHLPISCVKYSEYKFVRYSMIKQVFKVTLVYEYCCHNSLYLGRCTFIEICVTDTGNTVSWSSFQICTFSQHNDHYHSYPLRYIIKCNFHRAKRVPSIYTQELFTIPPTHPSYQHLYVVYIYYRTCCAAVPTDRLSPILTLHGYQLKSTC